MILLDTHVLLWLTTGDHRLGKRALTAIDRAWQADHVGVSAVSFWEVAMLRAKGRVALTEDVALWRREQLARGVVEIPVDGEIGIRASSLGGLHPDPADRIIVATAMDGHRLLTADDRILEWRGKLNRLDARK